MHAPIHVTTGSLIGDLPITNSNGNYVATQGDRPFERSIDLMQIPMGLVHKC